jgi:hypothetical protein
MNSNKRWTDEGGEIVGALARGYCSKENQHKVLDPVLIQAMAVEIQNLLDIGKHDHELLAELLTEALHTNTLAVLDTVLKLAPGIENLQTGEVTYDLGVMEYMARIKAITLVKDNK